jgi:hypothetical protein
VLGNKVVDVARVDGIDILKEVVIVDFVRG